MKGYTEIDSQTAMDNLLGVFNGFHDSVTKEVQIENLGFVRKNSSMYMAHQFNARILVQSQFEPNAVELVFYNVHHMNLNDPDENWSASGHVKSPELLTNSLIISLNLDGNTKIKSERMYWKKRPEWTGKIMRLSGPVPSPEAIPATAVKDKWRQCSSCCDAWEELLEQQFSYCPSCGSLTELGGTGPSIRPVAPAPVKSPPKGI